MTGGISEMTVPLSHIKRYSKSALAFALILLSGLATETVLADSDKRP